jgi:murein L,D-transpeptidase YafK
MRKLQRTLCAVAGSACLLMPVMDAAAREKVRSPADKPHAEIMLIEVYKALGADHLREALAKADALVLAYPTFRLGHLIRGDLLLMQTHHVGTLGPVDGPEDKLKDLREEAMVRLNSLRARPDPELVPRAILQMRDDQKQVLIVDAKRSRLYVYEHINGKLKFLADYYVSQGKFGTNKLKAGDQRTPIGVYYITGRVGGPNLPDFYGSGALPINYPNDWDRINGRSGSGIWLHGTPSDNYSRAPLSSDGCVVLTNSDLSRLSALVEVGKTPLVIAESVEFVNKTKSLNDRNSALKLVEGWRRDLESLDGKRFLANYSNQFKTERGEDRQAWTNKQWQVLTGAKNVAIKMRELTLFLYPGRDDLMVSTFTEDALVDANKISTRKRQYWAREGAQWRIVSEFVL